MPNQPQLPPPQQRRSRQNQSPSRDGYGYGYGYGSRDGYGCGSRDGYGYGSRDGYGYGSRDGNGSGNGYTSPRRYGFCFRRPAYVRTLRCMDMDFNDAKAICKARCCTILGTGQNHKPKGQTSTTREVSEICFWPTSQTEAVRVTITVIQDEQS